MEANLYLSFTVDRLLNEPIENIAKALSVKPDNYWSIGEQIKLKNGCEFGIRNKETGIYYCSENIQVEYVETEITALIDRIIQILPEFDMFLGDYETELCVGIYSNGQANPGIRIKKEDVQRLKQFNAAIDIDIYMIK